VGPEPIYSEHAFWMWASDTPDAVAIADRGPHLTYQELGAVLPSSTIFHCPTVRALAAEVELERAERQNPPRKRRSAELWHPLSLAQEQMAFVQTLAPEGATFHRPLVFRLKGNLDVERLSWALDTLSLRHPILRTVFGNVNGRFEQRVLAAPAFRMEQREMRADEDDAPAEHPLFREALAAPFALDRSAGRALLLRTGPDEHLLVLVLYHLITDGWSSMRLLAELGALYAEQSLPPLRRTFLASARTQRLRFEGGETANAERAWLAELAGAPVTTELPPEHARPLRASFRGALLPCRLDGTRTTRLSGLAREMSATENIALLAGLFALVSQLSGKHDLVIGVPHAGREVPGTEDVQGPYLSLWPLRVGVAPGITFRKLIAAVRDRLAAAHARGDVPFSRIVQGLGIPRDASRHPLIQIAFAPQPGPRAALSLEGLEVEPMLADPGTAACDVTVYTWPAVNGLDACFEYATDLYSEAGAARMRDAWLALLEQGMAHPDAPIEDASLVSC